MLVLVQPETVARATSSPRDTSEDTSAACEKSMQAGSLCCENCFSKNWLAGALRIPEVEAGVHTVGWLDNGLSAPTVARAAAANKVEVTPLNAFTLKLTLPQGLLLGFGAVDDREIRRGVDALAGAIEKSAAAA